MEPWCGLGNIVSSSISTILDNRVSEHQEGTLFIELTCGRQHFWHLRTLWNSWFCLKPGPLSVQGLRWSVKTPIGSTTWGYCCHNEPHSVKAVRCDTVTSWHPALNRNIKNRPRGKKLSWRLPYRPVIGTGHKAPCSLAGNGTDSSEKQPPSVLTDMGDS